jgi:ferredoxin-NADP reductase
LRRSTQVTPQGWARAAWFSVAIVVNALIAGWAWSRGGVAEHAVEASLINLLIAIAARHDAIVRGAFALGRPLRSYRLHQLTDHLGQLHRATAIAATVWFAISLAAAGAVIGVVALAILVAMMWTARGRVRAGRHESFERVHRYGGWTALALLSALVLRHGLVLEPSVVLLAAVLALVAHPWLGVRRVACEILSVTDQVVIVALPGRASRGAFVRVSREGNEWHAFAVATSGGEGSGRFCLVIRRAGDWTERLARDAECGRAPTHLFVRSLRGRGFMYHAQTYDRALVVATGAGIGPVLPYLLGSAPAGFECVWVGRDHRTAMGEDLVARVLAGGAVTLLDSSRGRPDVGAYVAAHAHRFEAVFVVSNEHVRDDVVAVCRRLDVPCYGPTFDS